VSKSGNTRRRAGVATDHSTATGIGGPGERARYVTHEEQLRAVLAHMRHRNQHLARAIATMLSAEARTLDAFGSVLSFVANEGRRGARGAR